MEEHTLGRRFRDIDSSGDAAQLLEYLDGYGSIPAVREEKQASLALLELGRGAAALDVGCGTGDDVLALAALVGPDGAAVGVDPSASAIAEAKRRGAGVRQASFREASAEHLPYPDATFDACRSDRTFQHLADPEAALRELIRVTRPGGRLAVTEVMNILLIDGAPDPSTTGRTVLGELWASRERTTWIGYMLPLLIGRAGLVGAGARSQERAVSSFDAIQRMFPVRRLAHSAVSAGRLAAADADRWLADLDSAAERGGLELRMMFLHAYGVKPPA
jgi:ubiquinone/menaquinone biosynthesis C-methylase UbiE